MFIAVSAGVLAAVVALLYAAHRRGPLLPAGVVLFAGAAVAFGLSYVAIATDYRDADGYVDCWPDCTAIQDAVSFGFFLAPVVAIVACVALLLARLGRRR